MHFLCGFKVESKKLLIICISKKMQMPFQLHGHNKLRIPDCLWKAYFDLMPNGKMNVLNFKSSIFRRMWYGTYLGISLLTLNILKMSSSIIDSPILKQRLHFSLEKREHYLFLEVHFLLLFNYNTVWHSGKKWCPKLVFSLVSSFSHLPQQARDP